MRSILFVTSLAFSISLVSAQNQETQDIDSMVGARFANGIAAIAEDKIFTVVDVRREIQPYLPQIQADSKGDPVAFHKLLQEAEDQIIQTLTDNVLIVKKFYEDKGQIPPSMVENRMEEDIITQFDDDRSKFLNYLKSIGKTPDEYKDQVREEMIVGYMRQQMRKSESFVSPVKIEEFYDENKEQFYQEESIRLSLIRLAQITNEDADLLDQTAAEIARKLDEGYDFAELAKQHSQDSRASRGGDWGWKSRTDLIPELSDIAFSLNAGQHSEPVKLKGNIFIMFAQDRRNAGYVPLSELRDQIEEMLVSEMAREAQERSLARLRRDGFVRRFN